jgi:phosphoglycerate dehydrogenase-like enzyme
VGALLVWLTPKPWSTAERAPAFPLQTSKDLHMSTIGFIGLGAMGRGMAASLRRAGHQLQVFDVRPEATQAFAAEGGACRLAGRGRAAPTW